MPAAELIEIAAHLLAAESSVERSEAEIEFLKMWGALKPEEQTDLLTNTTVRDAAKQLEVSCPDPDGDLREKVRKLCQSLQDTVHHFEQTITDIEVPIKVWAQSLLEESDEVNRYLSTILTLQGRKEHPSAKPQP